MNLWIDAPFFHFLQTPGAVDVSENLSGVKSAHGVTCGVKLQREGRKHTPLPRLWSSLIWGPALLALAYSSQHSHKDDKALIKANDWPLGLFEHRVIHSAGREHTRGTSALSHRASEKQDEPFKSRSQTCRSESDTGVGEGENNTALAHRNRIR
ncbi:hypothetical protein QQF64_008674 [Cirrhinus molitorella]|uniref:Uncharacterized protein n=1 Tax=Cirrhinus molitorella TaxID=172907 RepID=A0ABR3MA98_9TELE